MSKSNPQKLVIDFEEFTMAFGRDVDYHDAFPQTTHLDRQTGGIDWVYEDDEDAEGEGIPPEDNRDARKGIQADPKRYLELPGLTHGEHHEILKEFLGSDSTTGDEEDGPEVPAYFGSIGGWLQSVEDEGTKDAYYNFRDQKVQQLAEEFLRQHGIDPAWK